jgi:excisionase family DNA binding protein
MNLKEASDYLKLTEDQVRLLVEAHEIEGQQEGQEWRLNRVSVVAYKARQQAMANAVQSIDDDRKPGGDEDVLQPLDR